MASNAGAKWYTESERRIRQTLRQMARQQCAGVTADNMWIIHNAPSSTEYTQQDMNTCFMRGWVEPLRDALPEVAVAGGPINFDFHKPKLVSFYRLTDSGWEVINRAPALAYLSIVIAILSFAISVAGLIYAVMSAK